MEAQAWTAIGLLAAALLYLGNRIDGLGMRLDARIDGIAGRMDGLEGRMDSLSGRMDSLSGRMDGLEGRMDSLVYAVEAQGRDLGAQIYALATKLDDHLRRHAS